MFSHNDGNTFFSGLVQNIHIFEDVPPQVEHWQIKPLQE